MQKLVRRAARARASANNKSAARIKWHEKQERIEMDGENRQRKRELRAHVIREAARRKEDYKLGPLSPWRTNMTNKLEEGFGTMGASMAYDVTDLRDAKRFDQTHRNMLRVGDRVAIVRGHKTIRMQIGKIKAKDERRAEFRVESLNQVELENDPSATSVGDQSQRFVVQERYIPAANLALVYPLPNPQNNNIPEDCLIKLEDLHPVNQRKDLYKNGKRVFDRMIRPQNIIIPWPKEEEPVTRDHDGDTLRIDTEEESFYTRLMSPPMPSSVLDELRNKYSRMRRRHEPGYLQALQEADARDARNSARAQALLPGSKQSNERRPAGMSDELAVAIGEWMSASTRADGSGARPGPAATTRE